MGQGSTISELAGGGRRLPVCERPGDAIGPYRLLEILGEGGFGTVWLAERTAPMVQRVALKVIKPGMDSGAVVARFEQERQALAVMDHPNVAKVFDGGVTPAGRPFFVMEHVQGEPVTAFCDRHTYSVRQRLELFIPVCEAVQHAHHKGIIHRDIKPSNILVTIKDGTAIPKVIDFGVAKAISHALTDRTIFTETGQLIGTPEYMSPEQAEMGALDVDSRTDVYSLGVVLYELLTGLLPFDGAELRRKGYAEIQRIIREVEPPTPSRRLTTIAHGSSGARDVAGARGTTGSGEELHTRIARTRQTRLEELARELRRELEWIPLKALRKDRVRRYTTPGALAEDIRRYLGGRALEAGPESAAYRARKFVRRYRGPVIAASALVLVLVAGVIGTTTGYVSAARQKRAAEAAARAERERADELKQVADFQSEMLAQVDPTEAGRLLSEDIIGKFQAALSAAGVPEDERPARAGAFTEQWRTINATDAARELIDRTVLRPAVAAIERQFKDQPAVGARLRYVLGVRYRDLGLFGPALELQESALRARREVLGDDHRDTIASTHRMGVLLRDLGRLAEAESYLRDALGRARRVLGEDDAGTLVCLGDLGVLLKDRGEFTEAEPLYRRALEGKRRLLGEDHSSTISAIASLGILFHHQGRLADAEPYYREALERSRRVLGEEHSHTLTAVNNMGLLLKAQGKFAEAEPYFRETLEKQRRLRGEEHPDTLVAISGLGSLHHEQGRFADAEACYREALEKTRRVLGDGHPRTVTTMLALAMTLQQRGRLADAESCCRDALAKGRRVLGEDHPDILVLTSVLGTLLYDQGRHAEAEPYYREALEKSRRVLGDEHPDTLNYINKMGVLLRALGRPADAEPYYRESLEKARRLLGDDHPRTVTFIANMGVLLKSLDRLSEAEPYYREALEKSRRILGDEHLKTLVSIGNMGVLLRAQGRLAEAEPYYREALDTSRRVLGPDHPDTLNALRNISVMLHAQRKFDEAESCCRDAMDGMRRVLGDAHSDTLETVATMGSILVSQGRFAEAEDVLLPGARIAEAKLRPGRPARGVLIRTLVSLYQAWEKDEPGRGYGAKAAEWQARLGVGETAAPGS